MMLRQRLPPSTGRRRCPCGASAGESQSTDPLPSPSGACTASGRCCPLYNAKSPRAG